MWHELKFEIMYSFVRNDIACAEQYYFSNILQVEFLK